MGTQAIWGLGEMAIKKTPGAIGRFATPARLRTWTREKITGAERIRRLGEKLAEAPTPGVGKKGFGAAMKRTFAGPAWTTTRRIGKAISPTLLETRAREVKKAEEEGEKTGSASLLLSNIREELARGSIDRAIGLTSGGIKKGGGLKKALQENLTNTEAIKLGQEANKLGASQEAERIGRAFVRQSGKMNFKFDPNDADNRAKGYPNIAEKLIGEATKDSIKDFAKDFWTDSSSMGAVQKFWGGPQISKAADEFGRKFVDDFMKVVGNLSASQFTKINSKAAVYISGTAAQDLGFRSPKGLSMSAIKKRLKRIPPGRRPTSTELSSLTNAIKNAGFTETVRSEKPTKLSRVEKLEERGKRLKKEEAERMKQRRQRRKI